MRLKMQAPLREVAHWFKFTPCNLGISEWSGFSLRAPFDEGKAEERIRTVRRSRKVVQRKKRAQRGDESVRRHHLPGSCLISLHLNFLTCKRRLMKPIAQDCLRDFYFILSYILVWWNTQKIKFAIVAIFKCATQWQLVRAHFCAAITTIRL